MTTLTIGLPNFGPEPVGGWRAVVEWARRAEDAGVDRVVVVDHVVMGRNTDAYAWGKFPVPPEAPWLEPLTMLTAIATATSTIRLATGILIAPLRPAALLAKTAATLDVLAGGRLDLGVGTGWQREEYVAEGLDFDRRGQLLTDTMGACRALWSHTPAAFSSPTVSFDDTFLAPQPVQSPLPVWFSGVLHARNVNRIVTLGDGWIPIMGSTVDDVRAGARRLREAYAENGRDPNLLGVQGSPGAVRDEDRKLDLGSTMQNAGALIHAGATDINLNIRALSSNVDDALSLLPELVRAFDGVRAGA